MIPTVALSSDVCRTVAARFLGSREVWKIQNLNFHLLLSFFIRPHCPYLCLLQCNLEVTRCLTLLENQYLSDHLPSFHRQECAVCCQCAWEIWMANCFPSAKLNTLSICMFVCLFFTQSCISTAPSADLGDILWAPAFPIPHFLGFSILGSAKSVTSFY